MHDENSCKKYMVMGTEQEKYNSVMVKAISFIPWTVVTIVLRYSFTLSYSAVLKIRCIIIQFGHFSNGWRETILIYQ